MQIFSSDMDMFPSFSALLGRSWGWRQKCLWGIMPVENIPLLWEFNTGNQWRHDIPFLPLKWSKGVESEKSPLSLFSRHSSFMHRDFPVSISHGCTQAIQDKISPLSGWKKNHNSHKCVKTLWEHPHSSLVFGYTKADGKPPIYSDQVYTWLREVFLQVTVLAKCWGLTSKSTRYELWLHKLRNRRQDTVSG